MNRASPSAYLRGHRQVHVSHAALAAPSRAHRRPGRERKQSLRVTSSRRPRSSTCSTSSGCRLPARGVINDPSQAVAAATGLRYPVLVKANIGGSGAGIVRYDSAAIARGAGRRGDVELGVDGVALVQESAPLRDGHIVRVETLGGKYLYAINVYPAVGSFDLCPADACQTTGGVELVGAACAVDAPKTGLRVEAYTPPPEIIEQVERISRRAGLDIGGIEYLVDDRDGKHYFYDINALSNFVADAAERHRLRSVDELRRLSRERASPAPRRRRRMSATFAPERERRPDPSAAPARMRFGYWLPVFGGWLRNVDDERMDAIVGATCARSRSAARRSASTSRSSPSSCSTTSRASTHRRSTRGRTAAALAAVTERLELMVAVRPSFHPPAHSREAGGEHRPDLERPALAQRRVALVEGRSAALRRARSTSTTTATRAPPSGSTSSTARGASRRFTLLAAATTRSMTSSLEPKPVARGRRGRRSTPAANRRRRRRSSRSKCDAYVMHGDPAGAHRGEDRRHARAAASRRSERAVPAPPMKFGVAAYAIVRDTEREAQRELERITDVDDRVAGLPQLSGLDRQHAARAAACRSRTTRCRTAACAPASSARRTQVADRVRRVREAGVDLLLLQCSPQFEEMERFAAEVMPLLR